MQYPTAPNVEGLPPWLQVVVCVPFALAVLGAAFKGYRNRIDREPPGAAQAVVASFPDMSAVRQLTDTCRILCQHVESLDASVREQTHHMRNATETGNELCLRARELKEEIARSDRQRAQRRG